MFSNLYNLFSRVRNLFRPALLDRDLDAEMASHLQFSIEENTSKGMSPQEAERQARISFGGPQQTKESHRDSRGLPFLDSLAQDFRFAARLLLKTPSFSLSAVLTLALGIGATTAIFSVIYGVLLRPLPYPEPDQIVRLWEQNSSGGRMNFSDPNFEDVRSQSRYLASVAEYNSGMETISGAIEPERLNTASVSRDFFDVLGVHPFIGRSFGPDEQKFGAAPVAIVSHAFWRQYLNNTRDLGSVRLKVGDKVATVIGVMPFDFGFPDNSVAWLPREIFERFPSRSAHNWQVLARLREGSRLSEARSELDTVASRLKLQFGDDTMMTAVAIEPLRSALTGSVRPALLILLGASGVLLLIACANVANLALTQAARRERELCTRSVLGAQRIRLVRQFLTESFLLSLIGGTLGVLLANWGVNALLAFAPPNMPRLQSVSIDRTVLLFSTGTIFLVSIALGILTALRASFLADGQAALQSRGQTDSLQKHQVGRLLSIGQLASALILLVGAGLLGKSLLRVLSVDPGFRTDHTLTMSFLLPDKSHRVTFLRELISRLRTLPGVEEVGGANTIPLSGDSMSDGTYVLMSDADITPQVQNLMQRSATADLDKDPALLAEFTKFFEGLLRNKSRLGDADYTIATEGYFKALGIQAVQGRLFDDRDTPDAPHVALISQSLAAEKWPGQNPLGHKIEFGNMDGDLRVLTIVGVVGDVRIQSLEVPSRPTIYVNGLQRSNAAWRFTIFARTSARPQSTFAAARAIARGLDPEIPVELATFDQTFSTSLESRRFTLILIGCFSVAALLLAVVGIYGVTSYSVTRRVREIGIRMALGATASQILAMILMQTAATSAIGVSIGTLGSAAVTRLIQSQLFGVSPLDPVVFVDVALLLLLVSQLAGLIPSRRASRVDPAVALRYE
jgi:ABC-type antimicrobial peptide transport system permease subunit